VSRPGFVDRAVSRALRLPAPSTAYRLRRGLRVPMRDGVDLVADHYAPATDRPLGTILVRGPYGRSLPFALIYARTYAARGYHVLFQSVRGTFGSGGEFTPMVHEAEDAADTVIWLRRQPWFTGSFATIGLSYLGFTQWALLSDPPPELAAAVIAVGPHDLHHSSWGTGAFALNDFLGWSDMVANQETSMPRRLAFQVRGPRRLAGAVDGLPLGEAGRALLGAGSPWYESWIEHPHTDDGFWDRMRMTESLLRCEIPVLLIGGWQDVFVDQTLAQYRGLRDRGVDVAMTVGPWTHEQMVTSAVAPTVGETLDWLGAHLANRPAPRRTPVRVHTTGSRPGWMDMPDWPPATRDHRWFPLPDGGLGDAAPPGGASGFRYHPANPTPTVGGRLLSRQSGYRDDTALADRGDVLSFTGTPLPGELFICGHPVLELDYDCDNPHFDVFARISEVDPQGRSRNVSDGYRRFRARPETPLRIDLDPIAHRFGAGSRIRVLIAGGSHPRFARNLGTGEPAAAGQRMAASHHTLRHGAATVLTLPVPTGSDIVTGNIGPPA